MRQDVYIHNDELLHALKRISTAVFPLTAGNEDAAGVHVESLTEAVMGVTAGLMACANALENIASAIDEHGRQT